MSSMFNYAKAFNSDVSLWNVASVTRMEKMFRKSPFNRNVSAWNVASVTDMQEMFSLSAFFNGDVSSWDVSAVAKMTHMFAESAFNGDVSAWDLASVYRMQYMFDKSTFNRTICGNRWKELDAFSANTYGRSGCCDVGSYLLNPFADPFNATDGPLSSCQACPLGWYGSTQINSDLHCTQCPLGKSNAGTKNTNCEACPRGRTLVTLSPLLCQTCPSGKFTTTLTSHLDSNIACQQCRLGRYLVDAGHDDTLHNAESRCSQCQKGFQYTSPTSVCTICQAGRYQEHDNTDDLACKLCPYGKFNNDRGVLEKRHDNPTDCDTCTVGQFSSDDGTYCEACPAGKVKNRTSGECASCPTGKWANVSLSTGVVQCTLCVSGKYQSTSGQTLCFSCEAGKFSSASGSDTCASCSRGQYSTTRMIATACKQCPVGFMQNDIGQASCLPCTPGEFNDVEGATGCKECNVSTYINTKGRNSSCLDCPIGWSSDAASAKCQTCVAGKAGEACQDCRAGQYRGNEDTPDQCIACPTGYSTPTEQQPFCLACDRYIHFFYFCYVLSAD